MTERKKFYSSLGLLIILNAIVKPIWIFGIDRAVQNQIGTAEYGTYFSLFGFSIVFSFLLDWGLTPFFNRQLAADPESFASRASSFFLLKLLLAFVYAGIVMGLAYATEVTEWKTLLLVIIIQILTSLFVFLRSIITAQQWFRTDAWLSVIDKTLMIFFCGIFLYLPAVFGTISLQDFLLIQTGCTLLAVLVTMFILARRGQVLFAKKFQVDKRDLRAALPFALVVLLMSAHNRIDGFFLERLHPDGAHEAGLYAGAYRLLEASNMVCYLVGGFLLPFVSRLWSKHKKIDDVVINSRHLLVIFSLFIAITVFYNAEWLHDLLYTSEDPDAANIMRWCLPALVGYALVQVYGTVMTATGHLLQFCFIILLSLVLNIVLNFLMIPELGALACCYSAIASQMLCGIVTMIYVKQKTGISVRLPTLFIYIFIGALVGAVYYSGYYLGLNKAMLIITTSAIVLGTIIFMALATISSMKENK